MRPPGVREAVPLAIIVAVGMAALRRLLFCRESLYWGDIELYFAPMQSFLSAQLRQGRIPLWNPYILCGEPFVGNPQTDVLYPATLFAGLGSAWSFLTVDDALHLILGGLLFYLLARDFKLSRAASILSALSFMLGGYFITKIQFPNMTQAIAIMPAIVLQSGRIARCPSAGGSVLLGAVIGLQLLAAHAQITLMTLYLAAGYAVYCARPMWRQDPARYWGKLAACGCGALVLGCVIDGGQLLPILNVLRNSDRQTLSLLVANRFVMLPGEQAGFADPYAFGSPYFGNFSALGNYWEPACYLGIVQFVAMLWAAVSGIRRRSTDICVILIVFVGSIWLAEGRAGTLYAAAFYLVPGLRAFHDPARLLLGACVAGPILAGLGIDLMFSRLDSSQRLTAAALVLLLSALDLGSFDAHVYPLMPTATIRADIADARREDSSAAAPGHRVIFTFDNRATWLYFVDYDNFRRHDQTYFRDLLQTHTSNVNMLYGVMDAGGYEPEPPKGTVSRFVRAFNRARAGRFRGADRLCVDRVFAVSAGGDRRARGFFAGHHMQVAQNPAAPTITRAMLSNGRFVPVADAGPDSVAIRLAAHARPETVTLSDTDMPGWQASVGGKRIAVIRTADGFRAMDVPASPAPEALELRYRPASWRVGLFLTLIGAAFSLGYGAYAVSSNVARAARAN